MENSKKLEILSSLMRNKPIADACVDVADLALAALETFYSMVRVETAWKFNDDLSALTRRYTCSTVKKDVHLLKELAAKHKLLKTVGYENQVKKYNFKNDIEENGYDGVGVVTEVFREGLKGLVGKEIKIIGAYSMHPETGKIEYDRAFGSLVFEHEGKIIVENEINFKMVGRNEKI